MGGDTSSPLITRRGLRERNKKGNGISLMKEKEKKKKWVLHHKPRQTGDNGGKKTKKREITNFAIEKKEKDTPNVECKNKYKKRKHRNWGRYLQKGNKEKGTSLA